ncbi:MAG: Rieske 2Fe-2S domain-containing protein [Azospirillum sp.]|nr:Rieske 2Fe-2S domain-containing protein [Azospirillum sp.]
MIIVKFDRTKYNCVVIGDHMYFLIDHQKYTPLLCNSKCPHRGGPLHLGVGNSRSGAITCPWHDTTFPRRALERRSVPTVRVGNQITAVLDVPGDATMIAYHQKRIIANECP